MLAAMPAKWSMDGTYSAQMMNTYLHHTWDMQVHRQLDVEPYGEVLDDSHWLDDTLVDMNDAGLWWQLMRLWCGTKPQQLCLVGWSCRHLLPHSWLMNIAFQCMRTNYQRNRQVKTRKNTKNTKSKISISASIIIVIIIIIITSVIIIILYYKSAVSVHSRTCLAKASTRWFTQMTVTSSSAVCRCRRLNCMQAVTVLCQIAAVHFCVESLSNPVRNAVSLVFMLIWYE